MSFKDNTIAILGLGKVGAAIGYLLKCAGYHISSVASRSESTLKKGIGYTGGKPFQDYTDAAMHAEFIFITTPDDTIEDVCKKITSEGAVRPGANIIHTSGAAGLEILESARNIGANVACIHPMQSFANIETAIKSLPGSAFGVTAEGEIKDWSIKVVRDIGGIPFIIPEKDKALYHAAACIASNYLTTLIHSALEIYRSFGIEPDEALRAIWPLVMGTLKNIEAAGTITALTGPIARGDIGTVNKHLQSFRDKLPDLMPLYCEMGLLTVDIGKAKKTLSEIEAKAIKKLLKGAR